MPGFAANDEFNFHAKDEANRRQYGGAADMDKKVFLNRPARILFPPGTTLYKSVTIHDPLSMNNEPMWYPFYFTFENWNKLLYCDSLIPDFVSINIISPVYVWQGTTNLRGREVEQLYVPNMDLNFRSHGKGLGFPFRRFAGGYAVNSME